MKFLIDIDVESSTGDHEITPEEMLEHLKTYIFSEHILWEMSLLKNDPDHELGKAGDYISYQFIRAEIQKVMSDRSIEEAESEPFVRKPSIWPTSMPLVNTKDHCKFVWDCYLAGCMCEVEQGSTCNCPVMTDCAVELERLLGSNWHEICVMEWAS
jgi:hypothetical protein